MKKILSLALISIIGIFLFVSVARAVDVDVSFLENTPEETTNTDIAEFISTLYKFALGVSGIVAVGMIVAGGIFYSVSGESPQAQSEGKDMIVSALWGLGLLFGSYLILRTVNPRLVALELLDLKKPQTIASCTADKYRNGNKNEPITNGGVLIETFDENGNKENPLQKCLSGQETPPLKEITIGDEKRLVCDCYVPPVESCPSTITSKDVCPRKLVLTKDLPPGKYEVVQAIKPGELPSAETIYKEIDAVFYEIGSYYAQNEKIWKNSYIWLHPYYNKYGDVSSAKCLIYARKEPKGLLSAKCQNENDYTTCEYDDVERIDLSEDITPCRL